LAHDDAMIVCPGFSLSDPVRRCVSRRSRHRCGDLLHRCARRCDEAHLCLPPQPSYVALPEAVLRGALRRYPTPSWGACPARAKDTQCRAPLGSGALWAARQSPGEAWPPAGGVGGLAAGVPAPKGCV